MANYLKNPFLATDTYKLGHMVMYDPLVEQVYSYLEARKGGQKIVFTGLQYYILEYLLQPFTPSSFVEWQRTFEHMLGPVPEDIYNKMAALMKLGYWPVEICALPEGIVIDNQNVLMTLRSTNPDFIWAVGYLESLLLKVWNTCTVAACSLEYLEITEDYAELTCDNTGHVRYAVHDFSYRGVSSEETAALSGGSHLICFYGTDTLVAVNMVWNYYTPVSADTIIGKSAFASEHSVMCSYGREREFEAIDRIIFEVFPTGLVSIVSDTYNLWIILTDYVQSRKERIRARKGRVVFRPDSGAPVDIICGKPLGQRETPEQKGALQLLWESFGGTVNSKGYKVLDDHVGLIYGEAMTLPRYATMLNTMMMLGFASSNLVIGVGGLLAQNHNRDEHGFALKAVNVIKEGKAVEIYKDPITDNTKKSKKGFLNLNFDGRIFTTTDQCESHECELLRPVFKDGAILKKYSLEQVRENFEKSRKYKLKTAVVDA
jgi:nicotinamide phosphoribosyltransferase